jgi:large subunit ribosomal protein L1
MQELVKVSFELSKLLTMHEIIQTLIKLKPTAAKGCISKYLPISTMSPAIALDQKQYNW